MEKEFILCASIYYNGTIINGRRHSDCYDILRNLVSDIADNEMPQREHQGFLTSLNRFVDRKEGWRIAKENNQIKWGLKFSDNGEERQLISENLY